MIPPNPVPKISDRVVDPATLEAREVAAERKALRARYAEIVAFVSLVATCVAATSTAVASIIHDLARLHS